MATDEEILQLWNSFVDKPKQEAIIRFYRLAENKGSLAVEKELLEDTTIERALQVLGWGRKMKASLITQKTILREAVRLAKENVEKQAPKH